MTKLKTRPTNNYHCFEGMGLPFWQAIASGFSPVGREPLQRPSGSFWQLRQDIDGYIVQNGGMYSPRIAKLNPDYYFRFVGTIRRNLAGDKSIAGGWWIDSDTLFKIERFAVANDYSLARAAKQLLIIPNEWSDCGYLVYALLTKQMKAFVGKGKPASGLISPDSTLRDPKANPVAMGVLYLDIKQYFIPGSSEELSDAFKLVWMKQVTKTGVRLF